MIHVPHLETDVTHACQLSCVACNHHVPLWRGRPGGPPMAKVEQVRKDVYSLSRVLHTSVWGALGGEPTLHPQLVDILEVVKDSHIADVVEVWTNGIRIPRMSEQFWWAVDRIVLSRYEGKLSDEDVAIIRTQCEWHEVALRIMDERVKPNFRTLFEPVPTGVEDTLSKYNSCFFRQFSRVVNDGYFYTCCCAPHMPVLINNAPKGTDGILVEGITEEQLHNYLNQAAPLSVCNICAGRDTAVDIKWEEERRPLEWIRKSGMQISRRSR